MSWAAITPSGDTVVGTSGTSTRVGLTGVGTLAIDGGSGLTNLSGTLGESVGATGTVTVSGTGSRWSLISGLNIGWRGTGTLNVTGGGSVTNNGNFTYIGDDAGSTGVFTVDGAGSGLQSRTLHVGSYGAGTFNVTGGAGAWNDYGYIGYGNGSTGAASVSGAGAVWDNRYTLYVGRHGHGTLTVADGGRVATNSLHASLGDLYGNGTITTKGWVADADLVFDATHGLTQSLPFGTGGTLVLSASSTVAAADMGAGHKGNGSLRIADGLAIRSTAGYVGMYTGSTGTATVSGSGSKWEIVNDFVIGRSGSGNVRIESGASINAALYPLGRTDVGAEAGSKGSLVVTGAGSTYAENDSTYIGSLGTGTLTVADGGQVTTTETILAINKTGVAAATVSGDGAIWTTGSLSIAGAGVATLTLELGGRVSSGSATIGGGATGNGTVTVSGAGSKWINMVALDVGSRGRGTLSVTAGGEVVSYRGAVGDIDRSVGAAMVSGVGSKWTNHDTLDVGARGGAGTLTVADGGQVAAQNVRIQGSSVVRLHVSGDDMLLVGTDADFGTLTNNASIRMYADPSLPTGVYRPIAPDGTSSITWAGSGSYLATGGVWNGVDKTFTVGATTSLSAGASDAVSAGERLLFTDAGTGLQAGASFGAVGGGVNFSASPMGAASTDGLSPLLDPGAQVLAAWDFTTNFGGGSEVLLSFDVGSGAQDLAVWHLANGVWSPFDPAMLTYSEDGLASFTVGGFSGYAVTGSVVPEPGMLGLALLASVATLRRRERRH